MKKLKELWKKTSILTKIFIIFTAILVVIAISTLPIKQMEGVAFYVFSLWALYFLVYVIYMSGKIAKVKYDKKYIIVLIASIILSGAIYTYIVYAREYIYTWDNQYYYSEQLSVFRAFDIGFKDGIKRIITSTYNQDYGDFLLAFTGGIFSLTTRTPDAFVMTYFATCIIPVIIIFSMIVKKILDMVEAKSKLFLFGASQLVVILFPLMHKAAIMGQPDIFGLFFVGMIILLTMDYDFSKKDYLRWIYIAGITFLTMITRRWYMFWILGYFISYAILVIVKALLKKDKKELKNTIINLVQFGVISLVIVGILISPIIYRTLKNNYLTTYSAWSSGGLITEIKAQINRVGEIYFVIIALGIILRNKGKENKIFYYKFDFNLYNFNYFIYKSTKYGKSPKLNISAILHFTCYYWNDTCNEYKKV